MTTAQAAREYLDDHQREWNGNKIAVFNPHDMPDHMLPVIYGFNNGGSRDWWHAQLLAQDGTPMGGHVCSNEGYMRHDLGILEGARPDRHEGFRKHYPDGYRMEFVETADLATHQAFNAAVKLAEEKHPAKTADDAA